MDINETWFLKNRTEVLAWIRSAGEKMSMPYRGKGVFSGDTLYWGKGSKYFYLKCYSKGDEIHGKKVTFRCLENTQNARLCRACTTFRVGIM